MLGLIARLIGPVSTILDKVVSDKDLKEKLAHDIATMAERHGHDVIKAQIEVNKLEAQHKSIFVSGWRPSVGWCCSLAMMYHFIIAPMIQFGINIAGMQVELPEFDFSQLSTILMAMLGMAGLRTYEKQQKVTKGN